MPSANKKALLQHSNNAQNLTLGDPH